MPIFTLFNQLNPDNMKKQDNTIENRFQELFAAMVPSNGPSMTREGEMLRAIAKIRYRHYNDGDKWYQGYGRETAGNPAAYIMAQTYVDGLSSAMKNCRDHGYQKKVENVLKMIVEYIDGLDGDYTPHKEDMYKYDLQNC